MTPGNLRRASVWSAPLRLAHWAMALAVAVLLVTGPLLPLSPYTDGAIRDYHLLAGYVLLAALMLRLYRLLAGSGPDSWRDFMGFSRAREKVTQMLRFYLSLGRTPLPRWYAHNPLWAPVYLGLFAVLAVQCLSGFMLLWERGVGMDIRGWHFAGATVIAMFTLLHVIAVVLHDLRGGTADVSAMINGERLFEIKPLEADIPPDDGDADKGKIEVRIEPRR